MEVSSSVCVTSFGALVLCIVGICRGANTGLVGRLPAAFISWTRGFKQVELALLPLSILLCGQKSRVGQH